MNGLKTVVLLAAMGGLVILIGGAIGGTTGLVIGLMIAFAITGFSYWKSDTLAIRSARAVEVDEAQLPQYYAIMRELTQLAEMPMPRLYVSPEQQPNAFATGRNPEHAAVCVTEGLLRALSWDEIRGVLAHELAHIRNRDILIGSVAAAIAMFITFAARMAMWGGMMGGRGRGGNVFGSLALAFLAPVAAGLIKMAISRSREYEADRTAARLLGDGEPLARALEKLHGYSVQVPSNVEPALASNYIINPLAGQRKNFANMFATHPAAEERIRRLRAGEWNERGF